MSYTTDNSTDDKLRPVEITDLVTHKFTKMVFANICQLHIPIMELLKVVPFAYLVKIKNKI